MTDPMIIQLSEADGVDRAAIRDALRDGAQSLRQIPVRWRDATVTVPEVADWVRELVTVAAKGDPMEPHIHRGPSLLLTGSVGVGKTHQAWGAVRALCCSGAACQWRLVRASRMFLDLEPGSGLDFAEEFRSLRTVGLLVLDDLGSNKGSARREELLTELISERSEHLRPTLITTNIGQMKGETLVRAVGDRVASRLAEMCTAVPVVGPDLRREPPR